MTSIGIDLEDSRTDFDELDVQFLRDWGFTLKDTYKLTLRFYKGKTLGSTRFRFTALHKLLLF